MKETDLRIGNLIISEKGTILEVKEITHRMLTVQNKEGVVFKLAASLAKPIPLTKEWRKKLGITLFEGWHFKKTKHGNAILFDETKTGKLTFTAYDHIKYIQYVHEFQNFWKEFTGEELKIIESCK